jgi:hypothetical protein
VVVNFWSKLGFESKEVWQLIVGENYFLKVGECGSSVLQLPIGFV